MKRRDFITLLGGAAAWPLEASAQQRAMPLVGVLGSGSAQFKDSLAAGLKESGYIDGYNLRIECRWAEGAYYQLAAMADELVKLRVGVLAVLGTTAAHAAKAASVKALPTLPVVFGLGADPEAAGGEEGVLSMPMLGEESLGFPASLLPWSWQYGCEVSITAGSLPSASQ